MPFSVALTISAQFSEQPQVFQFLVHFQNSSYPLQWLQDVLKFIQSYYSLWSEPGLSVSNVIIKKHIPQKNEGYFFLLIKFLKDSWESKNNTWEKFYFLWIILVIILKKRRGFIWKKWTNQSNFFYWFPWYT